MSDIDKRLKELGLDIPESAQPVATYVGFAISGNHVYVSGQLPLEDGEKKYIGKLGADLDVASGQAAARLCAINIISQLKTASGGNLDRIKRIVRLGGFVNSTQTFAEQPQVINGASDLMVEVFGARGKHARAAVSAPSLPFGVSVEIDAIAELED